MAQLCGQQITEVEIIGDDDHLGSVRSLRFTEATPADEDSKHATAPVERRLLCTVAGTVAEAMVSGRTGWDDGSEDLDTAVRLAMKLVDDCDRVLPLLDEVRGHTEDLLRKNWTAVETLAEALLDRRRMTGEEVRRMLAPLVPR